MAQHWRSYRAGLRDGFDHARQAAEQLDPPLSAEEAASVGAPSDLDPADYHQGYRDGIVRFDQGGRRPIVRR